MSEPLISVLAPKSVDNSEAPAAIELSLKSLALACIGQLVDFQDSSVVISQEQQFLKNYIEPLKQRGSLQAQLNNYLKQAKDVDQGLILLAKQLPLDDIELLTIALALAVEVDPMVGRVIAYIQSPIGGSRPTLGLLESAFAEFSADGDSQWVGGSIVSGAAVHCGLLTILNNSAPFPEQSVQVPNGLSLALLNKNINWPGTQLFDRNHSVELPVSIHGEAEKQSASLLSQDNSILAIRSASLMEARSVASAICSALKCQPLFSKTQPDTLQGLGPLCLLKNLLPVFEYEMAPSETQMVPTLPGYKGPRLVIIGPDGNVECETGTLTEWGIPVPNQKERHKLWQHYLDDSKLAGQLARDHVHSAGRIRALSELALREAQLKQRKQPNRDDIRQAAWNAQEGKLGSLAQALTTRIPDDALVLPRNTRQELTYLLQRCKSRESLDQDLGITIKARYQMGVKALLVGPSGTGKTLVASWMATQLGLPLYRVDLASVVSKYIGETEKNLSTLLAKAEQAEIVLLFDEADSLFGKRTDIKDSNDRHANSQTNYLLQRIEFYKGIVLLTSNSRGRFDSAFTRRLDKVIEFPLPSPEERRLLWKAHLGSKHQISAKQFNQLAVGSDLSGGHIRNAALTAAVQARTDKRPINFNDIVIGLESEYRKLGRKLPAEIHHYQKAIIK